MNNKYIRKCLSIVITALACINYLAADGNLQDCFNDPPESAKPWVFWYWMCGNATREGITDDLEAMAEIGIAGAYLMPIDRPGEKYDAMCKVERPAEPLSDYWWELVIHALNEADRLGVKIALNACDGWATAGGPWITPEYSMQTVVWSTQIIDGGKPVTGKIKKPEPQFGKGPWFSTGSDLEYYRDIALIAFPVPSGFDKPFTEKDLRSIERIGRVDGKAGFRWNRNWPKPTWTTEEQAPEKYCVDQDKIINLTDRMDKSGKLDWTPPEGQWIIQRFGYTTTAVHNRPCVTGGGLECDKFNPEAVKIQMKNWFLTAREKAGSKLADKTLAWHHVDSWECGSQNWSPVFREEFTKRRGYDPAKYLPCMTGICIGSAEQSERFLWDLRKTISDLVSDGFFKTIVEETHKNNAEFSAECVYASMAADGIQPYRDVDFPMGEFWSASWNTWPHFEHIKDAVSGGHIYGKRIMQAEAFTQRGMRFFEDPYTLKPIGDNVFCQGINRFVLHVWPHQAFPGKKPGFTLFNVYGTFFSGNQTWHKQSKAWIDYLARCQAVLQQGLPEVDICYFLGEEIPSRSILRKDLDIEIPTGHKFDCINRDALITRAEAKDGKIVMPDGMTYRVLVLPGAGASTNKKNKSDSPQKSRMSPEVAAKIGSLAEAGVPVIGPQPSGSYSLKDYVESDKVLRKTVSSSWNNVRNKTTVDNVLQEINLPRDVEFVGVDMSEMDHGIRMFKSPPFCWEHRKTEKADIYFVAHQGYETRSVDIAFRVTGKQPELWHPETGKTRTLTDWRTKNGRTYIPLKFEPSESYFIVFRNKAGNSGTGQPNFGEHKDIMTISGPWNVQFEKNRGAPDSIKLKELKSLSEHEDFGIKHFSGTATYRKSFTLSESQVSDFKSQIYLDLGELESLAEVILNGKHLGVVWTPPFRVNVTDAIKEGENKLEIKVTNTWKNRLIADSGLPEDKRVTWTLFRDGKWFNPRKEKLEPAGLMGPVVLQN